MNEVKPSLSAIAVLGLLLSVFSGCDQRSPAAPDAIILHTGRLMGNVYPEKAIAATPLQHYQYLAGYINKVRAEAEPKGIPVFLIDLGDSIDGSFASYALKGANMLEFFNALKYDAVSLGNLDGDLSPELLGRLHAQVLCPFVDGEGNPAMPGTASSAVLKKARVIINVAANFYGLTDPKEQPLRFPASFGPTNARPIPVRDYGRIVAKWERKDALNLLTWMKFEKVDEHSKPFMKQLDALGFDLVLAHRIYGGEKRDAWTGNGLLKGKPPVSLNILRNNSGFTIARVDLKRTQAGWKVLSHDVIPMTANSVPADTNLVREMSQFSARLAEADVAVTELDRRWSEPEIFDLYLAALGSVPQVAAVAYSPSSIRSGWAKGPLRISQVYNSVPWRNDIVTIPVPRDRISQLNALPGLELRLREPLPDPVPLATSRFFAELIKQQSGFESLEVSSAGDRHEFEFFAEFLKAHPASGALENLNGWSDAGK